jgi:hypothetical protein
MNAPVQPPIDIAKRIDQFVRLRDKIAEIKKRHKDELAPYNAALDQLAGMLLHHLTSIGTDTASARGVGTVYRTEKPKASIADSEAFRRHVIGSQDFDIVDWKANAPAVRAWIEENGGPPPGVNFSIEATVGVRRA